MLKKQVVLFCCAYPAFLFSIDSYVWEQVGSDIEAEADGSYSNQRISIDSSGSILAISADGNHGDGNNRGNARVYQYSGDSWVQIGSDIDGEADGEKIGWSVSLSGNSTTLAIGSRVTSSDNGKSRVYRNTGGSWIKIGSDLDGGTSVSLNDNGSILAVGNTHDAVKTGKAKVYEYNSSGNSWTQIADIPGESVGDQCGNSVFLNSTGDILAVGAHYNDGEDVSVPADGAGDSPNTGHVRVFKREDIGDGQGLQWHQLGSDIDGVADYDLAGGSISLDNLGTTLAVAAYSHDADGEPTYDNRGHVRVFKYQDLEDGDGLKWHQVGNEIEGKSNGDESGYAVSLNGSGDILAIGSNRYYSTDEDGNTLAESGQARVFMFNGSSWLQLGQDIDGVAQSDKTHQVSLNDEGNILSVASIAASFSSAHSRVYRIKSPLNIQYDLEQLQDESISQIGFSFGQFSGISAVPFTAMSSAKSFTIGDNLVNPISFQIEYKPRIIIKNSNDLKSLEGSVSMNFTQNLAMGLDLGIIKKHSGAAVPSGAQIKNNIFKVGINSYYLANGQGEGYYQVGASLNSGKMNLSRQGLALGTESGHGIAGVSILSIIGGYHTKLENWSLPDYHIDLTGKLLRVTRDAYDEASDITNALSYGKFDRDELDLSLSVSKSRRLSNKVNLTLGSAIQGTLLLNQSDATMTEQSNTSNTWTISPKIENQARASVYASLGYKASDKLWVNTTLRAQRDAFDKHSSAYLSVSLSF